MSIRSKRSRKNHTPGRRVEILVADPDPEVCARLRNMLEMQAETWHVETVADGNDALNLLCDGSFAVAVLDVSLPNLTGLEILRAVRQKYIPTEIVLISKDDNLKIAVRAMKDGAHDILGKPVEKDHLVSLVRELIGRRHLPPHTLAIRMDAFLKERISDPSLHRGDLCRHFNVSPSHVSRLFRDFFEMTFQDRRSYFRIEKAKEMMETRREPLYVIAEKCGFKNQVRFTEAFRRLEEMPPRKYRQSLDANGRNE